MEWQDLDKDTQKRLIAEQMKGTPRTPENENRARQALIDNPRLLSRLTKQVGMDTERDGTEVENGKEEEPIADENLGIDEEANEASLSDEIPPPAPGEDKEHYLLRLQKLLGQDTQVQVDDVPARTEVPPSRYR